MFGIWLQSKEKKTKEKQRTKSILVIYLMCPVSPLL